MSLKFVTEKLESQSLVEDEHYSDGANDSDSGTESDDEQGDDLEDTEMGGKERSPPRLSLRQSQEPTSSEFSNSPTAEIKSATATNNDQNRCDSSSEMGIILNGISSSSPPHVPPAAAVTSAVAAADIQPPSIAALLCDPSMEDNYSSEEELKEIINEKKPVSAFSAPTSIAAAVAAAAAAAAAAVEKRKWSEIEGGDSELETQSPGGFVVRTGSSSSGDDEIFAISTPVQFRTSPPLDVYRPRQSQSPPPKLFHLSSDTPADNKDEFCEHTPSPSKRHRLTPRPHNIQRPCLDFEKMQQIKKRVVTSWRPQGTELSLFCW